MTKPAKEKPLERKEVFKTISGLPLKRVYTESDLLNTDPISEIGLPGQAPFTRGVQPTMFRGRMSTKEVDEQIAADRRPADGYRRAVAALRPRTWREGDYSQRCNSSSALLQ